MSAEKQKARKLFYSIGEVAAMFDVNTSLIRFWEKEFDILKPKKNKKGNRLFTQSDVKNLHIIYHLVKEKGFTLEGAKKHMAIDSHEIEKEVKIKETLLEIKSFLTNIRNGIK